MWQIAKLASNFGTGLSLLFYHFISYLGSIQYDCLYCILIPRVYFNTLFLCFLLPYIIIMSFNIKGIENVIFICSYKK